MESLMCTKIKQKKNIFKTHKSVNLTKNKIPPNSSNEHMEIKKFKSYMPGMTISRIQRRKNLN